MGLGTRSRNETGNPFPALSAPAIRWDGLASQTSEKMPACRRRVKVLIVALNISVCVLLYFWLRITSLMSEADGAMLLADDAVRERDRMKLNVNELNEGTSKVIESTVAIGSPEHKEAQAMGKKFTYHVPQAVQKKEPVTLATTLSTPRSAAVESPGHEEAQAMAKKFEYHFKVGCLSL